MALIEIAVDDKEAMAYLKGLRASLWPSVFREAAKEIERETLREFRRTTTTWKHKPKFESMQEITGNTLDLIVGTDDAIYNYVDQGTRPHIIRKRGNRPLLFRLGYRAKTTPGIIGSKAGGPYGDVMRMREVHHPGTRARNFGEMIQRYMGVKAHDIIGKKAEQWLAKRYV